ncbi:hypothetical protein [Georgenia sp. AZ-5]|uniref:hypothetical protein n=1 Tax=Georgenia sp. AZ-5 TaxID=3367526 RepID=UPI003754692F
MWTRLATLLAARTAPLGRQPDLQRGDVPGWVLVTLMTAGLVITIWALAGPALENVFQTAMNRVLSF